MPVCAIKYCTNNNMNCKNKCISFFSLPKNEKYRAEWLKHMEDPNVNLKFARVCSIHFLRSCYKPKPAYLWNTEGHIPKTCRRLLPDAVPTEYLDGELQPKMYGTKTEWIPSDGLNKSSSNKKSQMIRFATGTVENFVSSEFLEDEFVIYNCVVIQEAPNETNIQIDS